MLYSSKCLESLQTVFGQTILKYTWSLFLVTWSLFLVIAFVFAFVVLYLSLSICHRLFVCGLRLLSLSMSLILRLYQTQCTTKDGEIALLKASQEATELSCSAKDNQLQQLRADMADAVRKRPLEKDAGTRISFHFCFLYLCPLSFSLLFLSLSIFFVFVLVVL